MADNPRLGATFYPGSDDYYYPPEVIAPAPQRPLNEVPEQMQHKMANLELNTQNAGTSPPVSGTPRNFFDTPPPQVPAKVSTTASTKPPAVVPALPPVNNPQPPIDFPKDLSSGEPSLSHFPKLKNRPKTVPPSSDETEQLLDQTRLQVLRSNDPEMQLLWAQDALTWVDIQQSNEARISEDRKGRPQTPAVEHQLRTDALNIVNFLANQGHPKADFMRGTWLEFGKFGTRLDKREAFRAYARAAQKGYARAEYRMGMQFENSNEFAKAIKHYMQGAQAGDSASNYRLGMMTLLGQHGQKQDFARGIHLVRLSSQSADENAPQGAYVYGMMLCRELNGLSIPELFLSQDPAAARQHIERAAYLGFSKAQVRMGAAYEHAQLGCDFNPELSLHYNALAARQGEAEAEMAISKWFLCGHDGVFEKNEELAFQYAQRAAKQGYPNAEFAMGYMLEIGLGTKTDLKEAQKWYALAAEHGNKDAAARVDSVKRSKTLSRKDHERMAIDRIKSTRGDRRPRREALEKPPLPNLPERESRDPSPAKVPAVPAVPVSIPDRPKSAAPYPVDDDPVRPAPFINPALHGRPHSTYEDPTTRPATSTDFAGGNRPPAASFLNPNIRPATTTGFGPPPPPNGPNSRFDSGPNPGPAGRGGPSGGFSGPGGPGGYGYGQGPGPNAQPPYQGGRGQASPNFRPQDPRDTLPSRLDSGSSGVGYLPPLDDSNRRNKLQKPPPSGPSGNPQAHGALQQNNSNQPNHQRYSSGGNNRPPPHSDYKPMNGPYNGPPQGQFQGPPQGQHQGGPPVPVKYNQQSPPPQPQKQQQQRPQNQPPGRTGGPQTFEEIGVPPAKKEDDCIVM